MTEVKLDPLERACHALVGLDCWGVVCGRGTGSHVNLHFGNRVGRERWLGNATLDPILRQYTGEFSLLIECAWRVEGADSVLWTWTAAAIDESWIGQMEAAFWGSTVVQAEVLTPGRDLILSLENGLRLVVFCDQQEEGAENYSLYTPQGIFTAGALSVLIVSRRDES